MARRDRSFNGDDIYRIFCNNLTELERVEVRLRIVFQPCTGDNCSLLRTLIRIATPVCLLADTRLFSALRRIPYVGSFLVGLIEIFCMLQPYFEMAHELLCVENSQRSLTFNPQTFLESVRETFGHLIGSKTDEELIEEKREAIEYLTFSSHDITIF